VGIDLTKDEFLTPPDDPTAGRGPFIFITFFTAATTLGLSALGFFADVDAMYKGGWGLLEIGIYASLLVLCTFIIWHAWIAKGALRSIGGFALVALMIFYYEWLGVNYGWVFGPYHYTALLDPNIGGVSLVVVFGWGPITYASYYLTNFLLPTEVKKANAHASSTDSSLIRRQRLRTPCILMCTVPSCCMPAILLSRSVSALYFSNVPKSCLSAACLWA